MERHVEEDRLEALTLREKSKTFRTQDIWEEKQEEGPGYQRGRSKKTAQIGDGRWEKS